MNGWGRQTHHYQTHGDEIEKKPNEMWHIRGLTRSSTLRHRSTASVCNDASGSDDAFKFDSRLSSGLTMPARRSEVTIFESAARFCRISVA